MLTNFAVALAIVAASAEATEWGGDYGSYGTKSHSYTPKSAGYGAHSHGRSSYKPSSAAYDHDSFSHGLTSWATKNQGQNPAYPTRGSYKPSYATPAKQYNNYPSHSRNFNARPVAHKPTYTATHAPAVHSHYSAAPKTTSYHAPAPAKHHGYSSYAPQQSYGHGHSAHSHQHYTTAAVEDVSPQYDGTWWTPNQQYSPPLYKYAVAEGIPKEGLYAQCDFVATSTASPLSGSINFSQLPHQSIKVEVDLEGTPSAQAQADGIWLYINTDGDIRTQTAVAQADATDNCVNSGSSTDGLKEFNEFNNLQEIKDGVVNPYADETRGRIDDITAANATLDIVDFEQNDLLQNLAGHDSIIGRAVLLYTVSVTGSQEFDTVENCCVIKRITKTAAVEAKNIWLRPKVVATGHGHHYNTYPSHSYGHGYYH